LLSSYPADALENFTTATDRTAGNVTAAIDPLGHSISFGYDSTTTCDAIQRVMTMSTEPRSFRDSVRWRLRYSLGRTAEHLLPSELLHAIGLAVRDRMVDVLFDTERRYQKADAKRLYYLSMEFLIGRSLTKNLINLGLLDECRKLTQEYGIDFAKMVECEPDAALGNGGLGRLAACFLDSLASQGMPGFGYGINYEFGLFKQEIRHGEQMERPDNWRADTSPWMLPRPQETVLVPLYGRVEGSSDRQGAYNPMWLDWKIVVGVPHDMPIVGFGGQTVNYLRLFSARASSEMDMSIFNAGDYIAAVHQKVMSETISKVLYPSEAVTAGRELRLIQEYFLVACAVRDIVRRYQQNHKTFDSFPDKVAIQLNDTHPTLAIVELMRILIDEADVAWERAWEITVPAFGYTNHTLMSEALERWPVPLLEYVLPRHLQIIYEINRRFLQTVERRWPGDSQRLSRMSLIDENTEKRVRMANLAIVGSHSVNGVAEVHSRLVRTELVPDFADLWPEKFNNKTNGVTPRRWLFVANPDLANLITEQIGPGWITNLDQLRGLDRLAGDAGFQQRFLAVKQKNKVRLAGVIRDTTGVVPDPNSLFDVQVKRMHEYKRQLLNLLHVVHAYLGLRYERGKDPPRTVVFAGKAAPGYQAAKQIIRLIHDVAKVVNGDAKTNAWLKVAFVPDYRVSLAEVIIPAADLSEQISTAGTEASGTGNMKFAMNGAITIGTLDGANIEIREEVGDDNIFIFGLTVDQVRQLHARGPYRPREIYLRSPAVKQTVDAFSNSLFCPEAPGRHQWVVDKLLAQDDPYLHLADLESYLAAQAAAAALYRDKPAWAAKAIHNVARIGKFSSDRTIREYADQIWNIRAITS
jgi:glycogen phosphorylase